MNYPSYREEILIRHKPIWGKKLELVYTSVATSKSRGFSIQPAARLVVSSAHVDLFLGLLRRWRWCPCFVFSVFRRCSSATAFAIALLPLNAQSCRCCHLRAVAAPALSVLLQIIYKNQFRLWLVARALECAGAHPSA